MCASSLTGVFPSPQPLAGSMGGSSTSMLGECDGAGQEIVPLLEEANDEDEEFPPKHHRLRKSHRLSPHSSCKEHSRSERGGVFHPSKNQGLLWQGEASRQLWSRKEAEEESSHVKRKKRRRQKSWKYQSGEYLIERDKGEHLSCCRHKRRKSKAGEGVGLGCVCGDGRSRLPICAGLQLPSSPVFQPLVRLASRNKRTEQGTVWRLVAGRPPGRRRQPHKRDPLGQLENKTIHFLNWLSCAGDCNTPSGLSAPEMPTPAPSAEPLSGGRSASAATED